MSWISLASFLSASRVPLFARRLPAGRKCFAQGLAAAANLFFLWRVSSSVKRADVASQVPCRHDVERSWKECGQHLLHGHALRHTTAIDCSFIQEGQSSFPAKAAEIGQPLQCRDLARRRSDPALHLAPVDEIQAGPLAKGDQREPLFEAEGFYSGAEHGYDLLDAR